MRTRRMGTVAEILVRRMTNAQKSKNIFYDLSDEVEGKRIEVKFSTVSEKHHEVITDENIFEALESAGADRALDFSQVEDRKFDCNIQQIKTKEFDVLYYGLFFKDCVVMFRIPASEIRTDKKIGYSDKQHKGNVGEGQFHITNRNIGHHLENYHFKTLTYEEFIEVLR